MYYFYYSFIKKHLDTELLFTDTDSLTYEIFMKNFLSTNICLTLATIQKVQSFLFRLIKRVIGKMEDESEGS